MYLLNQIETSGVEFTDAPQQEQPVRVAEPMDMEAGEDTMALEEAVAPSSMSLRDVKITPLSSGFLVKVGCQSVAVETPEKLLAALTKYYDNPSEFERKWYEKPVINRLENIL